MSSDDGSTGGSPKRSWAAEEKKEQREVRPRGRHHDRVPSVERDVPSQGDTKVQEGAPGMGAMIPGLGQVVGRAQLGTPVEEGAAVPFPGALQGPLSRWLGHPCGHSSRPGCSQRASDGRITQSGARGRAGVSAQNSSSFQGGGRRDTGVSWQRTPNVTTRPLGQGCQDRGHPRTITHKERLGCRAIGHPREAVRQGGLGCRVKGHPNGTAGRERLGCQARAHPMELQAKGDSSRLRGGTVHCDPGTWLSAYALQELPRGSPWVTAIEVHPRKPINLTIVRLARWNSCWGCLG
ncbi:Hypothetical predicted protein [Mytilus galloprovincialis]|uniref:Uncharacterized protein n=1 Tax=Mytilus galloprovincialis TaxID=29158 RepID=A0A8B6CS84_MYTGA|nr:Hypothetical predicted protein [Mytilus galloprovincialis]